MYYTIGDQGKNQARLRLFERPSTASSDSRAGSAKNWSNYEGKGLRMNPDGSIPNDNPEINGVKSHIFTYGHRNAQGIAIGPNGDIYIAEHGDNSDDEINRLQARWELRLAIHIRATKIIRPISSIIGLSRELQGSNI